MDLLNPYTHYSDLQAITTPPQISTLYKSQQHPLCTFSDFFVFTSRYLATASNSGDSSAQGCSTELISQLTFSLAYNILEWTT
jgi:hypothetical protein